MPRKKIATERWLTSNGVRVGDEVGYDELSDSSSETTRRWNKTISSIDRRGNGSLVHFSDGTVLALPRYSTGIAEQVSMLRTVECRAVTASAVYHLSERDWTKGLVAGAWHRFTRRDGSWFWRRIERVVDRTDALVFSDDGERTCLMRFPEPAIASVSGPISRKSSALTREQIAGLAKGTRVSAVFRARLNGDLASVKGEIVTVTRLSTLVNSGSDVQVVVKSDDGRTHAFNCTSADPPDEFVEIDLWQGKSEELNPATRRAAIKALIAAGVCREWKPSLAAAAEEFVERWQNGACSPAVIVQRADEAAKQALVAHAERCSQAELAELLEIAAKRIEQR